MDSEYAAALDAPLPSTLSPEALAALAARASTLTERLGSTVQPLFDHNHDALAARRLETWRRVVAKGDAERFAQRLAWDGLDAEAVHRVLGPVQWNPNHPLPAWTATLHATLEAMDDPQHEDRCLRAGEPVPFEEVMLPFVRVARRRLTETAGAGSHALTSTAHAALERSLLQQLSTLAAPVLAWEFSAQRKMQEAPARRQARTQYEAFVRCMRAGGFVPVCREYPVLARLLATATDVWVEANGAFLSHLANDEEAIRRTFQPETKPGPVVAVQPALSDRHNRGRSVLALTFASGLKLVYKPKDLGLARGYNDLLTWINAQEELLPFKTLAVLTRDAHGWMAFAEHQPCRHEAAAHRFYERMGLLLGLLYVLQGSDCHHENVIACGEHPVLVDLEMLATHRLTGIQTTSPHTRLTQAMVVDTVLQAGFLPRWESARDGRSFDVSALAAGSGQETPQEIAAWQHVNTDEMVFGKETYRAPEPTHRPRLHGRLLSFHGNETAIISGFEQMYRFLLKHRAAFLAPDGPLAALARSKVRVIFRHTHIYDVILRKSVQNKYLHDGADRSIQLDVMARGYRSADGSKPFNWPLFAEERQALAELDIPHFAAYADDDTLALAGGQRITSCFRESGFDRVRARLQLLDEADLDRQVAIIRGTMAAYDPGTSSAGRARHLACVSDERREGQDLGPPVTPEAMVEAALNVAHTLRRQALPLADGRRIWTAIEYFPLAHRYRLVPLGFDLYTGHTGVALFLAALEHVTGGAGFRDLAYEALDAVRGVLRDRRDSRYLADAIGIGGAEGMGSLVYGLVRCSQFENDEALLDDARRAAALITPERIASDQRLDVMAGTAGALLGLLALHEAVHDQAVLEQARVCGRHLLATRTATEAGRRVWKREGISPRGFAQGAAGIAYALLRLYEHTHASELQDAALEAMADEWNPSHNEGDPAPWPHPDGPPILSHHECRGLPGLGLGRLDVVDAADARRELEAALRAAEQAGWSGEDPLCCGAFGCMDLLIEASGQLTRSEYLETARRQAAARVRRARRTGGYRFFPYLPDNVHAPSLHWGLAGVGYQLVRLAYPEVIPSVLLFV